MANDATLTPIANNEYKIEYISEDINIAVKTEDIDIHRLVFTTSKTIFYMCET